MIRDKVVFSSVGKQQKLLLREEKLDLERCIKVYRAHEQSNKHVVEIRNNQDQPVHKVEKHNSTKSGTRPKSGCSQSRPYRPPAQGQSAYGRRPAPGVRCKFCGYKHEVIKEKCPAWGKLCDSCGGRNQFKSQCKNIHTVNVLESDKGEDEVWLQCVEGGMKSKVKAKIIVNDCEVDFQIDTGAEIITINRKHVRKNQRQKKYTKLKMWNKSTVNSLGQADLNVKNPCTGVAEVVKLIIVPDEFECLLGLKTVQKLNLVTINTENFIGKVEMDLGTMGEVSLLIEELAVSVALPARNIPLAIQSDVKAELDNLVERDILEPVTEPTQWVNQMAVVRKQNGKLRICIDPQPLNKVLVRERYNMPTFDDILPKLKGAKLFTKLDVKEAFYHVKLSEESSKLTTMITQFGRYKWKRLPSNEIFQRKLCEALKGLEGTFAIADDIYVVGCVETEKEVKRDNEMKLKKLYERCESKGRHVKRNYIFGHKITDNDILPDDKKVEAIMTMKNPEDVTSVKRFSGLVQYMFRFLPSLSDTIAPIRALTRKGVDFKWTEQCETALKAMKKQLAKAPVL